jgi:hypothetical protein
LIGFSGRHIAWLISSGAQALSLTVASLQEHYKWNKIIPLVCLFADNFTFGIGTAPLPWFFVPELFPDSVRSLAGAIITAGSWVMGTLLFFIWDAMKAGLGQAAGFGFFAAIMYCSFGFGFTLPEPKPSDMLDADNLVTAETALVDSLIQKEPHYA